MCNTGKKLQKQPQDSLMQVIKTGPIELMKKFEPTMEDVQKVADKLLACSKVKDLGDASTILENLSSHLQQLKEKELTSIPIARSLQKMLRANRRSVAKKVQERQTIKVALEEELVRYEQSRNALTNNVDNIKALQKASKKSADAIADGVDQLRTEIAQLQSALATTTDEDQEACDNLSTAIANRENLIADMTGMQFIHQGNALVLKTQLQEREALYVKMGVFKPMLSTMLKTQLAALISQADVRNATAQMKRTAEGAREAAVATFRMAKEDAIETAGAVNTPLINAETINKSTDEIVGMVDGVITAINEAKTKQADVEKSASDAAKRIEQKMKELQQRKVGKE